MKFVVDTTPPTVEVVDAAGNVFFSTTGIVATNIQPVLVRILDAGSGLAGVPRLPGMPTSAAIEAACPVVVSTGLYQCQLPLLPVGRYSIFAQDKAGNTSFPDLLIIPQRITDSAFEGADAQDLQVSSFGVVLTSQPYKALNTWRLEQQPLDLFRTRRLGFTGPASFRWRGLQGDLSAGLDLSFGEGIFTLRASTDLPLLTGRIGLRAGWGFQIPGIQTQTDYSQPGEIGASPPWFVGSSVADGINITLHTSSFSLGGPFSPSMTFPSASMAFHLGVTSSTTEISGLSFSGGLLQAKDFFGGPDPLTGQDPRIWEIFRPEPMPLSLRFAPRISLEPATALVMEQTPFQDRVISFAKSEVHLESFAEDQMPVFSSFGVITSQVVDAGKPVLWKDVAVEACVPAGTDLLFQFRLGNTPRPDDSWTDWVPSTSLPSPPFAGTGGPPASYREMLAQSAFESVLRPLRRSLLTSLCGEARLSQAFRGEVEFVNGFKQFLPSAFGPRRFLQWRVFFRAYSRSDTPVMKMVTLEFDPVLSINPLLVGNLLPKSRPLTNPMDLGGLLFLNLASTQIVIAPLDTPAGAGQGPGPIRIVSFPGGQELKTIGPSDRWLDLAAGDIDRDGRVDLVAAGLNTGFHVFLGLGGLEFFDVPPEILFPPARDTRQLALGDLDGDGSLDLVRVFCATPTMPTLFIHRGWSGRTFSTVQPIPLEPIPGVARAPTGLALGDFNSDGDIDIAVSEVIFAVAGSSLGRGFLRILDNDGAGNFHEILQKELFINGLVAGDFDSNGHTDLICSLSSGGILVGRSLGAPFPLLFQESLSIPGAVLDPGGFARGGYRPAAADFDGDGLLDVVVLAAFPTQTGEVVRRPILLRRIRSPGQIVGVGSFMVSGAPPTPDVSANFLQVADPDADGVPDLVVGFEAQATGPNADQFSFQPAVIFENQTAQVGLFNAPPEPPSAQLEVHQTSFTLIVEPGTDDRTVPPGLFYEVIGRALPSRSLLTGRYLGPLSWGLLRPRISTSTLGLSLPLPAGSQGAEVEVVAIDAGARRSDPLILQRFRPIEIQDLQAQTGAQVRLSWTSPSVVPASYNLFLSSQVPPDTQDLGSVELRVLSPVSPPGSPEILHVTGLVPGLRYFFSLQAVDPVGRRSPLSNTASAVAGRFSLAGVIKVEGIGVGADSLAFGDLDTDGDPDLIAGGEVLVLRNAGGAFELWQKPFAFLGAPRFFSPTLKLSDFNSDGMLDLLFMGTAAGEESVILNEFALFEGAFPAGPLELKQTIPRDELASSIDLLIADFTRDGLPDVFTRGYSAFLGRYGTFLLENRSGRLKPRLLEEIELQTPLGPLGIGSGDPASPDAYAALDADKDGDLDLISPLVALFGTMADRFLALFLNQAGTLDFRSPVLVRLPSFASPDAFEVADLDLDGDLEVIVLEGSGREGSTLMVFDLESAELGFLRLVHQLEFDSNFRDMAVGDADNDGDPDIWLSGTAPVHDLLAQIRNDIPNGGALQVEWQVPFLGPTVERSTDPIATADIDSDGDLDVVWSPHSSISRIFLNQTAEYVRKNRPPDPPPAASLQIGVLEGDLALRWGHGTDDTTPARALAYQVRLGTTSGKGEILSPALAEGRYGSYPGASLGPGQPGLRLSLERVPFNTPLFFAVQSIDAGFARSEFSPEITFVLADKIPPQTTLKLVGSSFEEAGKLFVSPTTKVFLSATDTGEVIASGVTFTEIRADTEPFRTITATEPLRLSEGIHTIEFRSTDRAGNVEPIQRKEIRVDATSPMVEVAVGEPQVVQTAVSAVPLLVSNVEFLSLASGGVELQGVDPGLEAVRIEAWIEFPLFTDDPAVDLRDSTNVGEIGLLFSGRITFAFQPFFEDFGQNTIPLREPGRLVVRITFDEGPGKLIIPAGTVLEAILDGGKKQKVFLPGVTLTAPGDLFLFVAQDGATYRDPQMAVLAQSGAGSLTAISSRTPIRTNALDPISRGVASGVKSASFRINSDPVQALAVPEDTVFVERPDAAYHLTFMAEDRAGNLSPEQTFTVSLDNTPPVSDLAFEGPIASSVTPEALFVSTATAVSFVSQDPLTGGVQVGLSTTALFLDESPAAGLLSGVTFFVGSFSSEIGRLSEGTHRARFFAVDRLGNREAQKSKTILVDGAPPRTSLSFTGPSFFRGAGGVLVSSRTEIVLSAEDPLSGGVASGLDRTFFRLVSTAAAPPDFLAYAGPIQIPADGEFILEFFSTDRVGNTEDIQKEKIEVDATPPVSLLLSPSPLARGLDLIFNGKFPVFGEALDKNLKAWRLEFAPGFPAADGFIPIRESTTAAASPLSAWDTDLLSPGFYTLRLTVEDLVENISVITAPVFIGEPRVSFSIGEKEPVSFEFNKPEDVALAASGEIYVADRNQDRILRFSGQGVLLSSFTQAAAEEFNKPSGLALESQGNLWVSDTNNHRIVKLSGAGELLFQIGRQNPQGKTTEGKGPGEFDHPGQLALDARENLYVADTENNRIQVFSSTGAFLREIPLSSASPDAEPFGVAVDSSGTIFTTDREEDQLLRVSSAGVPITVLASEGELRGQVKEPGGLAVSSLGYLYAADSGNKRVQKFDPFGNVVLVFGKEAEEDKEDKEEEGRSRAGLDLNHPTGLSFGADGKLVLADRNNDRILILEAPPLPGGTVSSIAPSATSSSNGNSSGAVFASARLAPIPDSSGPWADPVFKERAVFIYPNPARAGRNPTIHAEVGLADKVEFRIYSLAGEFIAGTELPGSQAKIQINPDTGEYQYSYEWTWRADGVASGVYIALVRAHKEGEKPIKLLKKVAILR